MTPQKLWVFLSDNRLPFLFGAIFLQDAALITFRRGNSLTTCIYALVFSFAGTVTAAMWGNMLKGKK